MLKVKLRENDAQKYHWYNEMLTMHIREKLAKKIHQSFTFVVMWIAAKAGMEQNADAGLLIQVNELRFSSEFWVTGCGAWCQGCRVHMRHAGNFASCTVAYPSIHIRREGSEVEGGRRELVPSRALPLCSDQSAWCIVMTSCVTLTAALHI